MKILLFRLSIPALICLISGTLTSAQPKQQVLCRSEKLSVTVPPQMPADTISATGFVSNSFRTSVGQMRFHNSFNRVVLGLELLVEYLDTEGHSQLRMSYVGQTPRAALAEKFNATLTAETVQEFKKPLQPEQEFYSIGESFVVVTACPTKAAVLFMRVLFEGGQSSQWEEDNWKTDPHIKDIPLKVEFSCDLARHLPNVFLSANIDSDGEISGLEPILPGQIDCFDNLKASMANWKFYPALVKGTPGPSDLHLLIRFDSGPDRRKQHWARVPPEEIRSPTVVVDFIKGNGRRNQWVVVYGARAFGFTPKT